MCDSCPRPTAHLTLQALPPSHPLRCICTIVMVTSPTRLWKLMAGFRAHAACAGSFIVRRVGVLLLFMQSGALTLTPRSAWHAPTLDVTIPIFVQTTSPDTSELTASESACSATIHASQHARGTSHLETRCCGMFGVTTSTRPGTAGSAAGTSMSSTANPAMLRVATAWQLVDP